MIREWIGNKENPVILGFATLSLSILALFSILSVQQNSPLGNNHKLAVFLGVVIPACICFTTVGRLWYIPGPLLLGTAFLLAYSFWIQTSSFLPTVDGMPLRLLGMLGAVLILSSFGLAFFKPLFALFQTDTVIQAQNYRFEILPMDSVRKTLLESGANTSEDFEVGMVRVVHIMLILGASISLIACLANSRFFLGIGCLVSFSSLAFFLIVLPRILYQVQFPLERYSNLLGSLSLGWYVSLLGIAITFITWIQSVFLKAGR